jgi:hypothetical protein
LSSTVAFPYFPLRRRRGTCIFSLLSALSGFFPSFF